jgi:hypothetical protein
MALNRLNDHSFTVKSPVSSKPTLAQQHVKQFVRSSVANFGTPPEPNLFPAEALNELRQSPNGYNDCPCSNQVPLDTDKLSLPTDNKPVRLGSLGFNGSYQHSLAEFCKRILCPSGLLDF